MGRAAHLMTQTITVKAPSAVSDYGELSYGSASTQTAYVENKVETVFDANGKTIKTSHKVITETAIDRGSQVWVPGADTADDGEAKRIVAEGKIQSPLDDYALYEYRVA